MAMRWLLPFLLLLLQTSSLLCTEQGSLGPKEKGKGETDGLADTWLTGGAQQMQELTLLSLEYARDLQCWLWPEKCDEETHPAWAWPTGKWDPMQVLSDWYKRVAEHMDLYDSRVTNNLTGLQWDLGRRLHGQHVAEDLILTYLERFLQDGEPQKPLALSFHGWTGTGKNLAARIIAENLYEDGQRSRCIRVFIPQLHFPHLSHIEAYKVQLENQIREVSSRCPQPLFVFDEADKIPKGLLSSILPFLSPVKPSQSQSIFIFLSIGSNAINELALNFWAAGRQRKEITADDLERPLRTAIKENQGDIPLTQQLMEEGLIDGMVPFLPLERAHVKLCARDSFVARGLPYTEKELEMVAQQLLFVPKEHELFSAQGCKLVAQRISFMER
ncbi:torsin-1A isoform X2 [Xenopus laevis]|uniref:Torsin-1A isoform X2 n=1 Tax=Xenopus laevis TaxID=8355 RepID=A0A8J0V2B8_XENLA|nr:torsin-1A isoform X2 [Xenopus laevis]